MCAMALAKINWFRKSAVLKRSLKYRLEFSWISLGLTQLNLFPFYLQYMLASTY